MHALRRTAVCCVAAIAIASTGAAAQPADPELEALLTKATWYVLDFVDKLSNVVAEERYIQDSKRVAADDRDTGPWRPGRSGDAADARIGEDRD